MKVYGLIPARMESSRLPNKPLLDICGIPMVIHVAKRALLCKSLDIVAVCTDSLNIIEECVRHNVNCILTKSEHTNGTERIAEAIDSLNISDSDIVIDIQGDEPLISPNTLERLIVNFKKNEFDIMLPYIETNDTNNNNIVKISTTGNKILYMSRQDIPLSFSNKRALKKHLSVIAFHKKSLKKYSSLGRSNLEKTESIELLRAIENNLKLGTFKEDHESISVDVIEDYRKVQRCMEGDEFYKKYK